MEYNDDIAQFMVDLSNNYLKYFKKINGNKDNLTMFDGINAENKSSVNSQLESFYEEMIKFKIAPESKKQICKYENLKNFENDDELYGIQQNGTIVVVSMSLFALLIELTNLEYENPKINYNIICLS